MLAEVEEIDWVADTPVSTASFEMSIMTVKRIKTYARNSTGQARFSALAAMSKEKDLWMELKCAGKQYNRALEVFLRKERRILCSNKGVVWRRFVLVSPSISFLLSVFFSLSLFHQYFNSLTAAPTCLTVFLVTYSPKQFFLSILFSINLLFCYHLVGIFSETFIEVSFIFHF